MKSFTSYRLDDKQFPQKLPPANLIAVKALNTIAKFSLPLVLQSIYKNMQKSTNEINMNAHNESLFTILIKITISLSLSYFLDLYCEYIMTEYKLNLKKQLTKRILQNSIHMYSRFKEEGVFYINQFESHQHQKHQKDNNHNNNNDQKNQNNKDLPQFFNQKLSIWTNISSKMPVYVYNYHNSLLSLVFQSLNIIGVCIYLFTKLSYSLFFGLVLALIIMRKIVNVTKQMQSRLFNNIQLRQKKLKLLKHFFHHLVEYKMTWLDKWIFDKIQACQNQYQQNLQEIKYLDVWCVALWRFTSLSISSVVIVAFYFLDIKATQTITPSTLIQFLMILTMPLNALSWNIAGVRNSLRAINELKYTVCSLNDHKKSSQPLETIDQLSFNEIIFLKEKQIKVRFQNQQSEERYLLVDQIPISKGMLIETRGKKQAEYFLTVLPFVLKNKIASQVAYVQENAWQIDNILQSLTFKKHQLLSLPRESYPPLLQLLQIFQCHQIPQFSSITSKQLSGGEKMRINLVRAFLNSRIVVINSDLTSVDLKMRQKISQAIGYLVEKYQYCVFCRQVEGVKEKKSYVTAHLVFNVKQQASNESKKIIEVFYRPGNEIICVQDKKLQPLRQVKVGKQLSSKLSVSLGQEKKRQSQIEKQEDPNQSNINISATDKALDSLKWETLTTYYKSKYHLVFLLGIICTTFFEHLYQFYLNNYVKIQHVHDGTGLTLDNVRNVIILTALFALALFVRAYYFAVANIKETKRISQQLDQNIIMNQMDFYENLNSNNNAKTEKNDDKQNKNKQSSASELNSQAELKVSNSSSEQIEQQSDTEQLNKTSVLGSKLIYHSTTDIAQVSDNYPFHANILFNNIATTTSSILIVFSEIPFIGLILIPIIAFTIIMNNQYQNQSQRLLKIQKKIQENLLKTVHQIEEGIKYIYLYGKVEQFKSHVYQSVDKQINIEWKLSELKRKLNTKYKLMMIAFLVVIVLAFGMTGLYNPVKNINNSTQEFYFPHHNSFGRHIAQNYEICKTDHLETFSDHSQERNKSGKFAMLINYTITLANFMLFFTVSLGDTSTHALAIERIRPFLSLQNSQKSQQRLKDFQKIIQKIKKTKHPQQKKSIKVPMIAIKDLNFTYSKKIKKQEQNNVFCGLNFELQEYQKVQIRGKSGNGKTTLYKLLCSLYKDSLNTTDESFHISFSPQHPLILPSTSSIEENIDPYGVFREEIEKKKQVKDKENGKQQKQFLKRWILQDFAVSQTAKVSSIKLMAINQLFSKSLDSLTYQEKITINNLRAWLYGKNGVKIYDEPFFVNEGKEETYILTTHQRQFLHSNTLWLEEKKLVQK